VEDVGNDRLLHPLVVWTTSPASLTP
jgi:hypothetical protein